MIRLLSVAFFMVIAVQLSGQSIHGLIVDKTNQEPLPFALLMAVDDTIIADLNGRFSFDALNFPTSISISYLGYQQLTIIVKNADFLKVDLTSSALALQEVIVNGGTQYLSLKQVPGSIAPISKDMLARDDPFSFSGAVNRVPGVYMHSGTLSTARITIRGIGSRSLFGTNKIKAYYDQIPLTDGSGNSSIEDIDQGMIDRIEISKGPNSSVFGSGLAGVIQLKPYRAESNEISLESGLTLASFGGLRWLHRANFSQEKSAISLTHSLTQSAGYRDNNEFERNQLGLNGHFSLNENLSLSLILLYTRLFAEIPSAVNENVYRNNPKAAAPTWAASKGYESYDKLLWGINLKYQLNNQWDISTAFFHSFRDAYEPRPFNILDEETQSIGNRSLITYQAEKFYWTMGTELFFDQYRWGTFQNLYQGQNQSVQGDRLSRFTEERNYMNFFSELNYQFHKRISLTAGINFNSTFYQLSDQFNTGLADQSGEYRYDPILSPRLGFVFNLTQQFTLFANVSHGFSHPGLDETLNPDGRINNQISPETGWNFETGVRGNYKNLYVDATIYFMRISNLLVPQRTADDQYIGVNAGINHHFGVDLSVNYFLKIDSRQTLNFFINFSGMHYEFADFVIDEVNFSGNQLPGVPAFTYSPGIEWINEKGLYGNLTSQWVGAIPITDSNDLFSEKYLIVRGKAGYKRQLGKFQLDLSVGGNNLTQSKYASMLLINATSPNPAIAPRYYYPGLPRNYFGGISLKYLFR